MKKKNQSPIETVEINNKLLINMQCKNDKTQNIDLIVDVVDNNQLLTFLNDKEILSIFKSIEI